VLPFYFFVVVFLEGLLRMYSACFWQCRVGGPSSQLTIVRSGQPKSNKLFNRVRKSRYGSGAVATTNVFLSVFQFPTFGTFLLYFAYSTSRDAKSWLTWEDTTKYGISHIVLFSSLLLRSLFLGSFPACQSFPLCVLVAFLYLTTHTPGTLRNQDAWFKARLTRFQNPANIWF
jgi:hypothetical protein